MIDQHWEHIRRDLQVYHFVIQYKIYEDIDFFLWNGDTYGSNCI